MNRRVMAGVMAALVVLAALPAVNVSAESVGVTSRSTTVSLDRSRVVPLPLTATHIALHWSGNPDAAVSVATSTDGRTYDETIPIRAEHGEASAESYGAVIWTHSARFARVWSDRPLQRLTVVAIDARSTTRTTPRSVGSAEAAVNQPAVTPRAGWGADESLRFGADGNELWPPDFHPVQKLVVHHTAGRNADPDPAATVRAIYRYHAVTRGWGDIGYNFLIDESGRIYEGRYSRTYAAGETPTGEDAGGRTVTAAHVGGYNSGSVGIALLGTLTEQDATPEARGALEHMLAWKAQRHAIDPLGSGVYTNPVSGAQKQVANISGHRDWDATECPGGTFYGTLPQLRTAVSTRISGSAPTVTAPEAPALTASTPASGRGVQLRWSVPADGGSPITGYRILRWSNGSFVRIATVSGSTTAYRDTSTTRRRAYTYVVRAVNSVGLSPYSNEASAVAR